YQRAIALDHAEPDYYFGLGVVLTDLEEYEAAANAFRKVLRLDSQDAEAHNNLGNVLSDLRRFDQAAEHYRLALKCRPQYTQAWVNLGLVLEQSDQLDKAMDAFCAAIKLDSSITSAFLGKARVLAKQADHNNALKAYGEVLAHQPESVEGLIGAGCILRDMGEFRKALEAFQHASILDENNARLLIYIGDCFVKLDRFSDADKYFNNALSIDPESAEAYFNLALCYQAKGEFERAAEFHHKALAIKPSLAQAAYSLSALGQDPDESLSIERLTGLLSDTSLGDEDRINLQFALGKAYDREDDVENAFENYRKANEIKAGLKRFDAQAFEDYVDRIIEIFNRDFFESREYFGSESELPIFIVGMPRSGSTLVEQILASHSQIHGAGELSTVRSLMRGLSKTLKTNTPVPDNVTEIDAALSHRLAEQYLNELPTMPEHIRRVCDKMLGNFLRLNLIALLFPNARVIHCQRNALDTCLSCYLQNFAHGLRFTYNLEHLGIAYRAYRKLMNHWSSELPLQMFHVQYEALVEQQETVSRQLIQFCDLEWDECCLQFHRHSREVKTASFWQVRQPMYQSSVERWRRCQKFLSPLIEKLGELAE
ncbi:MAG: sulfotransferase, partial [Gammaproteobacteria bacterium]|nr:sulfotransferase [Gammaproteobacteria bacterium]